MVAVGLWCLGVFREFCATIIYYLVQNSTSANVQKGGRCMYAPNIVPHHGNGMYHEKTGADTLALPSS